MFAWVLFSFESFDVPALDEFIDNESNARNRDILLTKRAQAFHADKSGNYDLLRAHLDYLRLVMSVSKALPELSKKSHRIATSKGGKNRAEKDDKHKALNCIIEQYQKKIDLGYSFYKNGKPIHGRLAEFIREMAAKYPSVEHSSIKNRLEKYRREARPN